MKKATKLLSALLATLLIFSLSVNALQSLDHSSNERFTAIIYTDTDSVADSASALSALVSLLGYTPEITSVFEKAFVGFAANLTESEISAINSSPLFNAYISGSYAPLDYTEEDVSFDELIYTAAEMLSVPSASENSKYTGRGTVVAVIDNGFDITHSAFNTTPNSPKLSEKIYSDTKITKSLHADTTKKLYVSEKLPFVYNYTTSDTNVFTLSNHGTHVAAAIGGRDDIITGIAPDTQLLLMKVFDDSGNASEYYILQALEDAMTLGADVINMSIGIYSGFSEDGMTIMGRTARNLENAGVSVICAAGNDGTVGTKSYYNRIYGVNMPLPSHSDYGTLSYPATMTDYLAVASANNTKIAYNTLIHVENGKLTRINYTDTNSSFGIINTSFFAHFSGKALEYEVISGVGSADDFKGIDLTGKLALVSRGEITFAEKVTNAANAGAVGVVVYDNVTGEDMTYMELSGCKIPAAFISKQDGELLINSSTHELVFDTSLSDFGDNPNAYRISSFSAWGVTPELKLKPDITSIGERVYSAASGGNYSSLSGTSMASPLVAGAVALYAEKLNTEKSIYVASKRPDYIRTTLMNSATPLINPDTNAEYSPRVQGAGLVDFDSAITIPVFFTESGKNPSASLGNNLGEKFEIRAKISNTSLSTIDFKVSASVLTDTKLDVNFGPAVGVKSFNSLVSMPLENAVITIGSRSTNINRYAESPKSDTVSVRPGQTLDITFKVDISADKSRLDADFENGFFADGFIYLEAENFTCSLPFTGFVGDFYKSPALDTAATSSPFLYGNLLAAKSDNKLSVLGSNDLTINSKIIAELCAFSPNGDGKFDALCFAPSLVRNVRGLGITIIDNSTGETVFEDEVSSKISKSKASPTTVLTVWDGSDGTNPNFIFPDGIYTLHVTSKLQSGASGGEISLPFSLDTTLPVLKTSSVVRANGQVKVEIEAEDNVGVREVSVYTDGNTVLSDIHDGDGNFSFDITDLTAGIIWADITDYAMNTKTVKIGVHEEAGE